METDSFDETVSELTTDDDESIWTSGFEFDFGDRPQRYIQSHLDGDADHVTSRFSPASSQDALPRQHISSDWSRGRRHHSDWLPATQTESQWSLGKHAPEGCAPKERPKSEALTVHWAEDLKDEEHVTARSSPSIRRSKGPTTTDTTTTRPKSVYGGCQAISEALQELLLKEQSGSTSALDDLPEEMPLYIDRARMKNRRMSTPHPIRMRQVRSPPSRRNNRCKKVLKKAKSAPNLLDGSVERKPNRKKHSVIEACSAQVGDLAVDGSKYAASDEDTEDTVSMGAASESSSLESAERHTVLDDIFENSAPTYAEALWDHVTMDPEELGFRAGDLIEVTDMADKDWWWGQMDSNHGWFPAAFVRLRANQTDTADDLAQKVKEGEIDTYTALRRYNTNLVSREQARTNVVQEIIQAERDYVKHLKDVIEGYLEKCRKRPEMFPETRLRAMFGNIDQIYDFSREFLQELEKHIDRERPHHSQIGAVFINQKSGFEIYSEYCNGHPVACEEVRLLKRDKRFLHFFEACRLLQNMIEIPLDGFLLKPVQKICKYPLQLKELLKYTQRDHPDHAQLQGALHAMKLIAVMINERKRKMESLEKLGQWQLGVEDWQGPDLLDKSSELIYTGELTKVNSSGWHQERVFFLFDHQLVYCKKDLLWRDLMVHKGRVDLDQCILHRIEDGKDTIFNVHVRNAFRIYDQSKEKWFLMYTKSATERDKWMASFQEERQRVKTDRENNFSLQEFRKKLTLFEGRNSRNKQRGKLKLTASEQQTGAQGITSHLTASRTRQGHPSLDHQKTEHTGNARRAGWLPFFHKKTKR